MQISKMTGSEQLVRIILALALIGFSAQEHTTLIKAMAGYIVGSFILMNALLANRTTATSMKRN
jgi:hypothetical protein